MLPPGGRQTPWSSGYDISLAPRSWLGVLRSCFQPLARTPYARGRPTPKTPNLPDRAEAAGTYHGISGPLVEYVAAIDVTRAQCPADAPKRRISWWRFPPKDAEKKPAETRDRAGDLQNFSLTLSQLSYRGSANILAMLEHSVQAFQGACRQRAIQHQRSCQSRRCSSSDGAGGRLRSTEQRVSLPRFSGQWHAGAGRLRPLTVARAVPSLQKKKFAESSRLPGLYPPFSQDLVT